MNRLHSLDGMRALACLLVLLHHLGIATLASNLSQNGYIFLGRLIGSFTASGVELFFVLSATVLVGPFVQGARTLNLWSYVNRRIERLMPPYLVAWCVAGIAIYLASAYPTWWTVNASLPSFSALTWLEQVGIVYVGNERYNFAWWSLTTEVAFYALLPLIIPLFASYHKNNLALGSLFFCTIVLAILSTSLTPIEIPVLRELAIYSSCFCAGLVLACHIPQKTVAIFLCLVGALWICVACAIEYLNVHIGWGLIYFGLVALAMNEKTIIHKKLSAYSLVWVGERSYSLFLVHYSVIGLVCHAISFAIPGKSIVYFAITRTMSLVFSMLSAILIFHFVERRSARNLTTSGAFWPWRKEKMENCVLQPKTVRSL